MMERQTNRRAGFTLIEVLMVIVIIGVLVALLSFAAVAALNAAKKSQILTEINQLEMALEQYKNDRGAYPPSFGMSAAGMSPSDPSQAQAKHAERFMRHVRKAFPRIDMSYYGGDYFSLAADIQATHHLYPMELDPATEQLVVNPSGTLIQLDINTLDAAEALVLWIGGFPANREYDAVNDAEIVTSVQLTGFAADPRAPFEPICGPIGTPGDRVVTQRTEIPFEFDPSRLRDYDGDGWLEYVPMGTAQVIAGMPPYVYFDFTSYADQGDPGAPTPTRYPYYVNHLATNDRYLVPPGLDLVLRPLVDFPNWGICRPYREAATGRWANPKSFQIICAGQDSQYAFNSAFEADFELPWIFDKATPGLTADGDNLTNLTGGDLNGARP